MHKSIIPALTLAAVAALAGCNGSSGGGSTPSSSGAAGSSTASAAAVQQAPATTAAPAALLQKTGTGINTTEQFTTKGPWTLDWSYDCSKFGTDGNFIVTVEKDSGDKLTTDAGVNQLGPKGTGTEHFYDKATFHLSVNSECAWTVAVKG
ncbi:hypothetical protein [Frankia sp. ACN1ag]|uniref:hypothetical protein n=1 Tax=Frankia sp. ACN1ag TaxID=102891 RepID=UPI0006DC565A|nr:hypothetical protein [Frankia sp. ACN1ag]KQC39003.1 hypothetical protein UK82_07340 [Frankia sp. ACN1ag]